MILLDTHVLVWRVNGEIRKLSPKARQVIAEHDQPHALLISSVTIFEIATLERRGRLRFSVPASEWLSLVRRLPEYRVEPLTDEIAERAGQLGEAFPGDPADRMIAATALVHGVGLVTQDERLRKIGTLRTIW